MRCFQLFPGGVPTTVWGRVLRTAFLKIPPLSPEGWGDLQPAPRYQLNQRLSPVDALDVADGLQVRVLDGGEPRLTVQGTEEDFRSVRFGIEGSTLTVRREGRSRAGTMQLTIRVPLLRAVRVTAGSAATIEGVNAAHSLDLEAFGQSRLHYRSQSGRSSERLTISNSGSTAILDCHVRELFLDAVAGAQTTCHGGADLARFHCAAGSRLDAEGCRVDEVQLRLNDCSASVFASRRTSGVVSLGAMLFLRGAAPSEVEVRTGAVVTRKGPALAERWSS